MVSPPFYRGHRGVDRVERVECVVRERRAGGLESGSGLALHHLRDALKQGHIEDAQAAAEAIVNIISGAPGQDLDKNGTINQPGDGFGLKMYMFNANETISTAQNTAGLPDNLHTLLAAAQTNGTTILKDLNDVSTQATAFTATASLVKARELEPALSAAITTLDGDTATLVQAAATLNISGNTLITSS